MPAVIHLLRQPATDSSGEAIVPGVAIQPALVQIAPEGTATITLQASAPQSGLGSWTVDVQYDPSVLSIISASGENGTLCNASFRADMIRCTGASTSGLTGTQPIASFGLQAVSAAGSSSALTVSVATFTDAAGNPVSAAASSGQVQVVAKPVISSIAPTSGWPGGGTVLTITGSNFQAGATVTVGSAAATNVTVVNADSITAILPAHGVLGDALGKGQATAVDALCILRAVAELPATAVCPTVQGLQQNVDVVVTNPGGASGTLTGAFTYQDYNVSGADGGAPSAVDALCTLRIVAGLPATSACPAGGTATTTTASYALNDTGQGTSNFALPSGYSLPAAASVQAVANTSCFTEGGQGTSDFNSGYSTTSTAPVNGATCNPNNKYDHVVVVQDSAGNNYLLMNDGKTIEYGSGTTITINGTSEGTLMGNEWRDLLPGATVTATMSNGIASAITETDSYDGNLVTSVNPVNSVLTFTAGSLTVYYVNGSSAMVTLNGQPSTLSAIQPNDDVSVAPTAPSPMSATQSLFGATLGAAGNSGAAAQSIAVTRNTVSGTITSTSTSTVNLPWTGSPYTSVTITLQPSSGNAVTLTTDGDQPSAQNAELQSVGSSVTLVLDASGGILYVLATTASYTLNDTGQGTSNFALPSGYSLPAAASVQAIANTSCFTQGGQGTLLDGQTTFNQDYNSTSNTGEICNPNDKYAHVLVVQDAAGTNYLLMSDGKTVEYGPSTTITVNGTSEGTLMGSEWRDLIAGATVTAVVANGMASSISETYGYDGNLVTAVNPGNGTLTFTSGTETPFYVNSASATVTLNGQPATGSAIEPNDDVNVAPTAPSPMSAFQSLYGATLGASTSAVPAAVQSIADTRNTISGTITSSSTSTVNLPWTGSPYTLVTITLQQSNGTEVTLTTDGDQPSTQNAELQSVGPSVTLVLDASGGILYVLSTNASSVAVAMLTAAASNSTIINGITTFYFTLTGIAGSGTTTYYETTSPSGFVCTSSAGTGAGAGQCSPSGQPNTLTNGFDNFWALSTNAAGQVTQATYLAPVTPPTELGLSVPDSFVVVSAGATSAVIEALNPVGAVDVSDESALTSVGFSNGYLTVTNGSVFSGVTSAKNIGFSSLQPNDVVTLYSVTAPQSYSIGALILTFAIVDSYR